MRNERGSVIVWITLMIVLLMVMVGMGLDTGQMTYSRNTGQAAVDAAALSAVSALPLRDDAQVKARALMNTANTFVGSASDPINTTDVSYVMYDYDTNTITNYAEPIATANGVRVSREAGHGIATPTFLMPLLKLMGGSAQGSYNVNVSAVSTILSRPSLPIVLWSDMCSGSGIDVKIQMQHPDQKSDGNENACWTTYSDCSSGAPDIKAGFQAADNCTGNGLTESVGIGSFICQNKGQVNTVLQTADDFFNAHPNRWWIVPVIGGTKNCDAKNPTAVVNWAKIYPKDVVKTGNPKYILADVVCGKNIPQDPETSMCFSHRLVREPAKGM